MKIFGYRKLLLFTLSAICLMLAFKWSLEALLAIEKDKATQLASMLGGLFAAFSALITAVYSALKGSYQKDTALGVAQCEHGAKLEK